MSRISTPVGISVLVVLAALGAVLAFLLVDDESAGPEEAVTFEDIIENPRAYDGDVVTISAEVQRSGYFSFADAQLLFLIGDDTSGSILVYPQPGTTVPDLDENSVVRVTGVVEDIEPNQQTDAGFLNQARVLSEESAEAAINATEVTVPGGDLADAPTAPPARDATVDQLLSDPSAWNDRPVQVRGEAWRVTENGFFLVGDSGRSIFVGAPSGGVSELESGERVRVRAELERISRFRADTIAEALRNTPETEANAPAGVDLDQTPTQEGQPFLVLREILGAGPGGAGEGM